MSASFHRAKEGGGATGGQEAADRKYRRWGGEREEEVREDGGGRRVEEQKVQGGERGREAMAERLPPALSQPHAWLLLPLIVIAVQTRPTAATNISCLI